MQIIKATNQIVHCKATQITTQNQFHISIVDGLNSIAMRQHLWPDIRHIARTTHGVWRVMGDFNAALHLGERMVGEEVQHTEVKDFAQSLGGCEL